jgi:HEAT repeat protein
MLKTIVVALLVLSAAVLLTGPLLAGAEGGKTLLEAYEARRAAVAADDEGGLCRLGLWCGENGLSLQARQCYEAALAIDTGCLAARKALGYAKVDGLWLRGDALRKARGFVRLDGRWVLREEAVAHHESLRAKLMKNERTKAQLEQAARLVRALGAATSEDRAKARAGLEAMPAKVAFRPLLAALNSSGPVDMRKGAVEILATHDAKAAIRPLIRASITDPSEVVRHAAVAAVGAYKLPGVLAPYATALGSLRMNVRNNAAAAIGNLGSIGGIGILIRHWEQIGGGSSRAHVYHGNQLSFIQDFDVEVAQTAFIADPMIGTLQDGSVLEVKVMGTERRFTTVERQIIRGSLKKLSGVDMGSDVKAWVSWAARNGSHRSAAPADLKPTREMR